MSDDGVSDDIELDYDYLMQRAFRYLMRDVLTMVADLGDAPGEHHFYIEFLSEAPGVDIPDHLKEQYPERMTIVLQHQFDSLDVSDEGFEVTLWFKSKEARLKIPFDAVTSFADPSTQFGLRFEPEKTASKENEDETPQDAAAKSSSDDADASDTTQTDKPEKSDEGADIVSLDAFRKK